MTCLWVRDVGLGIGLALASSGCTEQPRKGPPTEQEIHAGDSGVASRVPGRHLFRCTDRRELLVDFKDEGLAIELRWSAGTKPIVLTAPMQGLQYVGEATSATFAGSELTIEAAGKPSIRCRKETTG
ncbi:conserved hypothetical protein [Sphingomonas sp. EC-HK361]|uniref:hypothetical protein n=1 Tax=Sphingomonas sp. EC-HK361 TaxID=2038397 RepID=UPI001256A06B|nr:hypothetical protein [Sphingomonas sp. EC-HK361]VVT09079.1 conserved hypothetical protein [Sphingomonas sp. EC-HK361]